MEVRKSCGDELMGVESELEKNGRLAFAARVSVMLKKESVHK